MTTYDKIRQTGTLPVKKDCTIIRTIDMHTGGEPLRIILDGYPELKGNSVLEYRNYFKENLDYIRTALMYEPRGHADMYGCVLVPPNDDEADIGIIFLHNEGYSTMCGHAIIAISKLAFEMEWKEVKDGLNSLVIDAPCGRIFSWVMVANGKVSNVSFDNVPSFVVGLDRSVYVEEMGEITYDLAYGGAFYAYIDLSKNKLLPILDKLNIPAFIEAGRKIKKAVQNEDQTILHPFEQDLSFLYGCIFIGPPEQSQNHSRNICIFADGEVDRSPTGSGVAGRMAIHYKRNEVALAESIRIESIVGSVFSGKVKTTEHFGPFEAVIPTISGTAFITGYHTFILDPDDPSKKGFLLR